MKRTIYVSLTGVTLLLMGYTGYVAYSMPSTLPVATTTPETSENLADKKILTTKTGKKIFIQDSNPGTESLSTITITSEGMGSNNEIVLEKNKLTDSFLLDMNNDGYDELVLITTAQEGQKNGEIAIYTTFGDKGLTAILSPEVTEELSTQGGMFEGYRGFDTYSTQNGIITRSFPTFNASDTESVPTGVTKNIYYFLHASNTEFSLIISNSPTLSTTTLLEVTASSTASAATSTGTTTQR